MIMLFSLNQYDTRFKGEPGKPLHKFSKRLFLGSVTS